MDENRQSAQPNNRGIMGFLVAKRLDSILWITRLLTIGFALSYLFPFFSNSMQSYQRALLSSAATSTLRLHQRMPPFQFSRVYFSQLMLEDSFHYLMYSFIFFNNPPLSIVLVPIVCFAVLHATSFTKGVLDQAGPGALQPLRLFINRIETNSVQILRFIALLEIVIMPTLILLIFMGGVFFMTPFLYYQFIVLRYLSRRNPYSRQIFTELRIACEGFASDARVPSFAKNILLGGINLISRIAPNQQAVPPQQ